MSIEEDVAAQLAANAEMDEEALAVRMNEFDDDDFSEAEPVKDLAASFIENFDNALALRLAFNPDQPRDEKGRFASGGGGGGKDTPSKASSSASESAKSSFAKFHAAGSNLGEHEKAAYASLMAEARKTGVTPELEAKIETFLKARPPEDNSGPNVVVDEFVKQFPEHTNIQLPPSESVIANFDGASEKRKKKT